MVIDIDPIAFSIGPLSIYWYGILMAVTFVTGYTAVRYLALHHGMPVAAVDDVMFKGAITIFVGARLGVVVTNLPYYLANPLEIVARPGLGSHGAVIAVMIVGWFLVRRAGLSYWRMADAAAILFPIGHIFIRLGNFINGELYGSPTSAAWGVQFRTTAQAVHPVQLYEAGFALLFLPLAWYWAKNAAYPGYAFFRIVLVHSLLRLGLDSLRQHTSTIGPFVLTQWLAILLAVFCAIMIVYKEKNPARA